MLVADEAGLAFRHKKRRDDLERCLATCRGDERGNVTDWLDRYGIDPNEITASVEAALVGQDIARRLIDAANGCFLRFMAETVVPEMTGLSNVNQARLSVVAATILRRVGETWETELTRIADGIADGTLYDEDD